MNPSNPDQLAIAKDTSLPESKKIALLLKLAENVGSKRAERLVNLIDRVKSVATAMRETTTDDEEHELHPTHESKANFVTPRLPIMSIEEGQLELSFFIFAAPENSPYKPSINAQWFLKDDKNETKLLQEYASAKSGSKDQMATLGLIEDSVKYYEAAYFKEQVKQGYRRIAGLESDDQI